MSKWEAAIETAIIVSHAMCAGMMIDSAIRLSGWWWLAASAWGAVTIGRAALLWVRVTRLNERADAWRDLCQQAIDKLPPQPSNVVNINVPRGIAKAIESDEARS